MAKLAVPQITPLISLKRFPQISESHCGPAVLQMLLNYQGVSVSQQEITKSSKVTRTIKEKGIRPDQLSNAVRKLAPGFKMYYKDHGSLRDVASIINDYHLPVAVEWQGLFGLKIDPKSYKPVEINDGHYSIIIKTDNTSKEVTLLDPYKDFIDEDRVFTFDQFNKRWWDTNEIIDKKGKPQTIYDYKLFFIVIPDTLKIDPRFGLKLGKNYNH